MIDWHLSFPCCLLLPKRVQRNNIFACNSYGRSGRAIYWKMKARISTIVKPMSSVRLDFSDVGAKLCWKCSFVNEIRKLFCKWHFRFKITQWNRSTCKKRRPLGFSFIFTGKNVVKICISIKHDKMTYLSRSRKHRQAYFSVTHTWQYTQFEKLNSNKIENRVDLLYQLHSWSSLLGVTSHSGSYLPKWYTVVFMWMPKQ